MSDPDIIDVPLERPLSRGDSKVEQLRLRRPKSGDLRGISIAKLGQLDYDEVRTLLPRISEPRLIGEEVDAIDPADMIEIAGAITDFLFTARRKAEFQTG